MRTIPATEFAFSTGLLTACRRLAQNLNRQATQQVMLSNTGGANV